MQVGRCPPASMDCTCLPLDIIKKCHQEYYLWTFAVQQYSEDICKRETSTSSKRHRYCYPVTLPWLHAVLHTLNLKATEHVCFELQVCHRSEIYIDTSIHFSVCPLSLGELSTPVCWDAYPIAILNEAEKMMSVSPVTTMSPWWFLNTFYSRMTLTVLLF